MVRSCSVRKCVSGLPRDRKIRKLLGIKQASLFSTPTDPELLSQWSSALRMNLSETSNICDYHFKAESIIKENKYNFPDGSFQIFPRGRWSLLANAVPINSKPRRYDDKVSENRENQQQKCVSQLSDSVVSQLDDSIVMDQTDEARQPFQPFQPHDFKRLSQSPVAEKSAELTTLSLKSNNEQKNIDQQPLSQKFQFINDFTKPQLVNAYENRNDDVDEESNVVTKQVLTNPMDGDKTINSFDDIKLSIAMPQAWYYIHKSDEMIFVHMDRFKFTEKLRVILNADMSVMVSFNKRNTYCMNLKVTCNSDVLNIFEELRKATACSGTGIKDMSASAKCSGVIMDHEKYQRQQRNPRCTACRTLRRRLLSKVARQRHAAKKKYHPTETIEKL